MADDFDVVEEFLAEKILDDFNFAPREPREEKDLPWSRELCEKILAELQKGRSVLEVSLAVTNRAGKNPSKAQVIKFKRAIREYTAYLRAEEAEWHSEAPAENSD